MLLPIEFLVPIGIQEKGNEVEWVLEWVHLAVAHCKTTVERWNLAWEMARDVMGQIPQRRGLGRSMVMLGVRRNCWARLLSEGRKEVTPRQTSHSAPLDNGETKGIRN